MSSSLIIRKRKDSSTTVEGGLPDEHLFASRWIARELGTLCKVTITLTTTAGEEEYDVVGFDPILDGDGKQAVDEKSGEPKWNYTGLRGVRRGAKAKKTKAES